MVLCTPSLPKHSTSVIISMHTNYISTGRYSIVVCSFLCGSVGEGGRGAPTACMLVTTYLIKYTICTVNQYMLFTSWYGHSMFNQPRPVSMAWPAMRLTQQPSWEFSLPHRSQGPLCACVFSPDVPAGNHHNRSRLAALIGQISPHGVVSPSDG